MVKNKRTVILIFILGILSIGILFKANGIVGLSDSRLENDARISQKIDDTWSSTGETNNEMGALLFYDETIEEHTFSIYLNRPGFSYGYFFSHGGASSTIDSGVKAYSYGAYGMVLMSMNTKKVSQIKLENEESLEIVKLDPLKPFVLLVPEAIEKVSLFDTEGKNVPIDNIEMH